MGSCVFVAAQPRGRVLDAPATLKIALGRVLLRRRSERARHPDRRTYKAGKGKEKGAGKAGRDGPERHRIDHKISKALTAMRILCACSML